MSRTEPPNTIYLQWIGADRDDLTEEQLQQPAEEKTWCQDKIYDTDLEYRLVERSEEVEPDIDKCPKCGGPADNGFDRCIPPSPYYCTKCEEKP